MLSTLPKTSKISVLLADDHQMLLDLWTSILSRDNRFEVCGQATSSSLAIELARTKRPDIILLDINITPLDGFETTKLIRPLSPSSKIIGVSMYVLPAYAKKMKALGAMGYVTKNSSAAEMIVAMLEAYESRFYYCKQILEAMEMEEKIHAGQNPVARLLTGREIEIIQLIKKGLTSKQIAHQLHLSPKTINIHRNNIFRKLNVKNMSSLVTTVQQMGI